MCRLGAVGRGTHSPGSGRNRTAADCSTADAATRGYYTAASGCTLTATTNALCCEGMDEREKETAGLEFLVFLLSDFFGQTIRQED